MTMLNAESITAGYGEADILHDVHMRVESGQIVSIIGPNGAGKSTLLKTIFGLLKPGRGKIALKGEDITGLKPDKIARKGISYVPQVNNIFPSMTFKKTWRWAPSSEMMIIPGDSERSMSFSPF